MIHWTKIIKKHVVLANISQLLIVDLVPCFSVSHKICSNVTATPRRVGGMTDTI